MLAIPQPRICQSCATPPQAFQFSHTIETVWRRPPTFLDRKQWIDFLQLWHNVIHTHGLRVCDPARHRCVFWADVDTTGACSSAPACNKVIWRLSTPSNNPGDLTTTRTFLGTTALPDYVLTITWLNVSVCVADIIGPHPQGTPLP